MFPKSFLTIAIICFTLLGVSQAQTEQPTSPNPLDIVPEKMPFDIPYGTPISLEKAEADIAATIAEAKKRDWKMNVAVVDSGGNLVAFRRMDGAQGGGTSFCPWQGMDRGIGKTPFVAL